LTSAQLGQRDVPRDPMQPRAQLTDLGPVTQRLQRSYERLLQRVLSPLVTQERAAMTKQSGAVAQNNRREGGIVSGCGEPGKLLVGLAQQERWAKQPG
jgi:hypothetical protein